MASIFLEHGDVLIYKLILYILLQDIEEYQAARLLVSSRVIGYTRVIVANK